MPSPTRLYDAFKAIAESNLPDHYRLVLYSLLRHQARQKNDPNIGLAWPKVDTIAGDTHSVTPAQVASALQHMCHIRILRATQTEASTRTRAGLPAWELRIEHLAMTDPLLQLG